MPHSEDAGCVNDVSPPLPIVGSARKGLAEFSNDSTAAEGIDGLS